VKGAKHAKMEKPLEIMTWPLNAKNDTATDEVTEKKS
jgi:hypothetical protein